MVGGSGGWVSGGGGWGWGVGGLGLGLWGGFGGWGWVVGLTYALKDLLGGRNLRASRFVERTSALFEFM